MQYNRSLRCFDREIFFSENLPFNVESLLPLQINRESADHATVYTACTCPRKVATKAPVCANQRRTVLSKEADAKYLKSNNVFTYYMQSSWIGWTLT